MFTYLRHTLLGLLTLCLLCLLVTSRTGADTIAYYRFEEGSGTTLYNSVNDLPEGTFNGTFESNVPVNPVPQNGDANDFSIGFDGTESATFSGEDFILHNKYKNATLEFWLNVPNPASQQAVFWTRIGDDDTNRFNIYINPGGGFGYDYRDPDGNLHTLGSCTISNSVWTHIAITRTVKSAKLHVYRLYINGVLVNVANDENPNLPTSTGWTISGRGGFLLQGLIDEVRCSDAALHPSQFLNVPPFSSLTVTPNVLSKGESAMGTITLSSSLNSDTPVTLDNSDPSVISVPDSVTVYAGKTSATFIVTASKMVTLDTPVTLSATLYNITKRVDLLVTPARLSSLKLAPISVVGGKTSKGTVTLSAAAPTGGFKVSLSSSDTTVASVPTFVMVPEGEKTATFPVTTSPVATLSTASITASFGGISMEATLTVNVAVIHSLSLKPTTVKGGEQNSTATITLTGDAPEGGVVVTLSSDNTSAATVQPTVTVPAGSKTTTFTVTSLTVTTMQQPKISATTGAVFKYEILTVNP